MQRRIGIVLMILALTGTSASAQNDRGSRNQDAPRSYNGQSNGRQQQPYDSRSQGQGTADEQTACTGDAKRYCSDAIPYTFRVLACLQRNRNQISDGCRYVLESHGQ